MKGIDTVKVFFPRERKPVPGSWDHSKTQTSMLRPANEYTQRRPRNIVMPAAIEKRLNRIARKARLRDVRDDICELIELALRAHNQIQVIDPALEFSDTCDAIK